MKLQLLIFSAVLLSSSVSAQEANPAADHFHDKDGNTWHQLFLDFKAEEILELKYTNTEEPVDGILSPDGLSILIKNYPGDKTVKAIVKLPDGESREISKGKCFIDPVVLFL